VRHLVTASGKKYKNAARWYCRHSCYQSLPSSQQDLDRSTSQRLPTKKQWICYYNDRRSQPATVGKILVAHQLACLPPQRTTSNRLPAIAARIVWPAIPQPLPDKSACSGRSSLTFLEVHKRTFSGPPNLNCADNRLTVVISASGCLECTDIPQLLSAHLWFSSLKQCRLHMQVSGLYSFYRPSDDRKNIWINTTGSFSKDYRDCFIAYNSFSFYPWISDHLF
jgi:hypothetical protein